MTGIVNLGTSDASKNWATLDSAPRDGLPFLLGTSAGGIMLEFWHWHAEAREPHACVSGIRLRDLKRQAPNETFLWLRDVPSPLNAAADKAIR